MKIHRLIVVPLLSLLSACGTTGFMGLASSNWVEKRLGEADARITDSVERSIAAETTALQADQRTAELIGSTDERISIIRNETKRTFEEISEDLRIIQAAVQRIRSREPELDRLLTEFEVTKRETDDLKEMTARLHSRLLLIPRETLGELVWLIQAYLDTNEPGLDTIPTPARSRETAGSLYSTSQH